MSTTLGQLVVWLSTHFGRRTDLDIRKRHDARVLIATSIILVSLTGSTTAAESLPRMCAVQQVHWEALGKGQIALDNGQTISVAQDALLVSSQGKEIIRFSPKAQLYRDSAGDVHVIDGIQHKALGGLRASWPELTKKSGIVAPNCLRTMLNGMGLALTASGLQSVKGLSYSKPAEQQLKVIGCY